MGEWNGPDNGREEEPTPEWLADLHDLPTEQARAEYAEHLREQPQAKPTHARRRSVLRRLFGRWSR